MVIFLHLFFSHIPSCWICSKVLLRSLWHIKTWSVTWVDAWLITCSLCLAFSINLLKSQVIIVKCHVTIMQWLAFYITSFVNSQSLCYLLLLFLPISDPIDIRLAISVDNMNIQQPSMCSYHNPLMLRSAISVTQYLLLHWPLSVLVTHRN